MKISFIDFWGEFDDNNNFFYHLIKEIKDDVTVTSPDNCDILFCGCYSSEHSNYTNPKKIYYSSEPWANPNMQIYNFSLTGDDPSSTNIRIPHWVYYIDWFNVGTYSNPEYLIPIDYFFNPNPFSSSPKNKFASWVFNNPVFDRLDTINNIKKYKEIDLFGRSGIVIPNGESKKLNVISNYKFNFCFENTIKKGYYTEKLLHAKVSGCVPIYKSHELFTEDFNPLSCINVSNMSDEEILNTVIEIDSNFEKYSKLISEPLFNRKPNLDYIKNDFYNKIF
jgi:hypothetical protein